MWAIRYVFTVDTHMDVCGADHGDLQVKVGERGERKKKRNKEREKWKEK